MGVVTVGGHTQGLQITAFNSLLDISGVEIFFQQLPQRAAIEQIQCIALPQDSGGHHGQQPVGAGSGDTGWVGTENLLDVEIAPNIEQVPDSGMEIMGPACNAGGIDGPRGNSAENLEWGRTVGWQLLGNRLQHPDLIGRVGTTTSQDQTIG